MPSPHPLLDVAPEVAEALRHGQPVVALESTIISHGMPYPQNVATALQVQADVRAAGAVPATVAVLNGRLQAGLSDAAIEQLGRHGTQVEKVSRRDLPFVLAAGRSGATTVAATMIVAAQAGIRVFATGGIGGVHRGAAQSFDISADLQELARTPVTVVAAGAKAILDLPKTLEVLETLGVPVIAFGQDQLPAFWSRESGLAAPLRMDDPAEIAASARIRRALGLAGGQLVVNPIPPEAEIPREVMIPVVEQALAEADAQGTPGLAVDRMEQRGVDAIRQIVNAFGRHAELIGERLHAMKNALGLVQVVLDECWLEGDEELKFNAGYHTGLLKDINRIIAVKGMSVVKY